MRRVLELNLHYDLLSVGMEVDLTPVESWWESLKGLNASSREREEVDKPFLSFWTSCPACQVDITRLAPHKDGGQFCMRCKHRLPCP
jgi:hypothetical protein